MNKYDLSSYVEFAKNFGPGRLAHSKYELKSYLFVHILELIPFTIMSLH